MIRHLSLALLFGFSLTAFASSPQNQPGCSKLKAACEKAGFKAKGKKGHQLVEDCMKKVTSGKKVKGIKLKAKDGAVTSCKEVMNMAGKPRSASKAKKPAPPPPPAAEDKGSSAPDLKKSEDSDIEVPDIPPPKSEDDEKTDDGHPSE